MTAHPALQANGTDLRQLGQIRQADPAVPVSLRSIEVTCGLFEGAMQFFSDERGTERAVDLLELTEMLLGWKRVGDVVRTQASIVPSLD
ncbi:hypothetical protein GCM10008949_49660 [Deinococcus humi]|nr:hypothetical protein GCM10008949_49660 [Deinococcus humi]